MSHQASDPSESPSGTRRPQMPPACSFCLELELTPDPGRILIARAHGVCDMTAILVFNQTLDTLFGVGFTRVVLDLTDLHSLEREGVVALRRAARRSRALGGGVAILCPPDYFREQSHLRHLLGRVPVLSQEDEAVGILKSGGLPGSNLPR